MSATDDPLKKAPNDEFLAHAGPVSAWQLDSAGRPEWIAKIPDADRGPWACIVPPLPLSRIEELFWPSRKPDVHRWEEPLLKRALDAGPVAMPCFRREHVQQVIEEPENRQKRGRRRLEVSEYERVRWIAWVLDVKQEGLAGAARRLEPSLDSKGDAAIQRHFLRKAGRYRDRGRRVLWREGVLPWFAFPDGKPFPRWDTTLLFQLALRAWYEIYVVAFRDQIQAAKRIEALLKEFAAKSADAVRRSQEHIDRIPEIQQEWVKRSLGIE